MTSKTQMFSRHVGRYVGEFLLRKYHIFDIGKRRQDKSFVQHKALEQNNLVYATKIVFLFRVDV